MGQLYHGTAWPIGPVHQAECTLPPVVSALSKLGTGLAATFCAKFSRFSWTISFLHILCVLVTSIFAFWNFLAILTSLGSKQNLGESYWPTLCVSVSDDLSRSPLLVMTCVLVLSIISQCSAILLSWPQGCTKQLLRRSQKIDKAISRPLGPGVGGERFCWEGNLPWLRVGIRVDQSEHPGGSLSKSHHVKHHHVSQKFTNSWARCTKWATRVLATAATSWISTPETKSHPLHLVQ